MAPLTPDPASPLYQSDIAQTPLPEVLVKIHRYRAPGRVDCRRGGDLKRIYLERGDIVFATTSLISESLGDRLLQQGRITRQQYDESLARVRQTGKRHGTVLVEMKILGSDELFQAVQQQIEAILWSVFAWDFGTVAFTPGRDKRFEFIKVDIPVPQAVMKGVRFMPDPRGIVARLGAKNTLFIRTAEEAPRLSEEDRALLEAVDGKRVLYDLVNLPPLSPADNSRVLYGLYTLGLIAPRESSRIRVQINSTGKRE